MDVATIRSELKGMVSHLAVLHVESGTLLPGSDEDELSIPFDRLVRLRARGPAGPADLVRLSDGSAIMSVESRGFLAVTRVKRAGQFAVVSVLLERSLKVHSGAAG
jgi:hypothetical protein